MERGTKSRTLADLLPLSAEKYSDAEAVRFKQGDAWASRSFGEVGEVNTGSTHAGVFSLPPGTYALACFETGKIGGGEGPVHATIGMTYQFTVT